MGVRLRKEKIVDVFDYLGLIDKRDKEEYLKIVENEFRKN